MSNKKLNIVGISIAFLLGCSLFTGVLILQRHYARTNASIPKFAARDPYSDTVVRVTGSKPVFGPVNWSGTIYLDGQHATQYTGWPKDRIAESAEPTGVQWHSNPDWVEISLSSGEHLKLTWDQTAATRARSTAPGQLSYLNPEFAVLPPQLRVQ